MAYNRPKYLLVPVQNLGDNDWRYWGDYDQLRCYNCSHVTQARSAQPVWVQTWSFQDELRVSMKPFNPRMVLPLVRCNLCAKTDPNFVPPRPGRFARIQRAEFLGYRHVYRIATVDGDLGTLQAVSRAQALDKARKHFKLAEEVYAFPLTVVRAPTWCTPSPFLKQLPLDLVDTFSPGYASQEHAD